jgi:hypothetical protein
MGKLQAFTSTRGKAVRLQQSLVGGGARRQLVAWLGGDHDGRRAPAGLFDDRRLDEAEIRRLSRLARYR